MNELDERPGERPVEVVPARHDYPLMESQAVMSKILRLIDENLGGVENLDPLKLSRIRVPTGGDTDFKVETASGMDRRSTLIGVITAFRQARAYWVKAYGTGRTGPPDCSSIDGFTGVGKPGGACTACPLARYNTARGPEGTGPGQACKELRQLLILLPGQMLPHLLSIPPTSLANFTKYSLNLISAGETYWQVTTRLTLEATTSMGGAPYARIRFALHGAILPAQVAVLVPFHQRMLGLLAPTALDTTAYEVVTEDVQGKTASPVSGDDDIPF